MKKLRRSVRPLLRLVTILVGGLLLAAHGGRWWWVLDNLTNYWPQMTAALALCAGLLLLARDRRPALLTLALALYGSLWVWPMYLPPSANQPAAGSLEKPITLLLSNVYSFRPDLDDVLALVGSLDPDIVVLLETVPDHYTQVETLAAAYPYHFHEPRVTGQAIFSKIPFESLEVVHWPGGRIDVLARLGPDEHRFLLIATHGRAAVTPRKAQERNAHLAALADFIAAEKEPVLLAGDLNTTPFSSTYIDFREAAALQESRRGRGLMGTWPNPGFLGLPPVFSFIEAPLDHILATPGIAVQRFEKAPPLNSDHDPLWAAFTVDP